MAIDYPRLDLDNLPCGRSAAVGVDAKPPWDHRPALNLNRPARPGRRVDHVSRERDDHVIERPLRDFVMPRQIASLRPSR